MKFQVLVSCTATPCLKCRTTREPGYFLSPVANGTITDRIPAEADAQKCRETTGKDGAHRYDVAELRADGWPLCPWCGDDELYSLAIPALADRIAGCYRCGTTAPKIEVRA